MPCGKKPLVKTWDKPRNLRVAKHSRYEQNEQSVKLHWRNVIRDLELSYKDEKFWESQSDTVRELVGNKIFERIAKIFDLKVSSKPYESKSEVSIVPSEDFYNKASLTGQSGNAINVGVRYSISDYAILDRDEEEEEEEEGDAYSDWTISDESVLILQDSRSKTFSAKVSKSRTSATKSTRSMSGALFRSLSAKSAKSKVMDSYDQETARTSDDLDVHAQSEGERRTSHRVRNPHYDMLYCNESESDMIKWNSNYKQKKFEISASDEYSKKAELLTKQIAYDFFEWWTGLGNVEFKSEIKSPEDIEALFQIWFDEHASRGLVLDPKILPCVLESIAEAANVPKAACSSLLKRQIAWDIHAETSPKRTRAFNTTLPPNLMHIPPKNNTKEMWGCVKIPQDLKTMECVWGDISHLTSTKSFQQWLRQRPFLPMPQYLSDSDEGREQRQPFAMPSDIFFRQRSSGSLSNQELAMPVSEFSIEIKDVLSRMMDH